MGVGKMDDRVTFQTSTQTKDALGGYSASWTGEVSTWAYVQPMKGSEALEVSQIVNGQPYECEVYYDDVPGLDMHYRVEYEGEIYELHSIVKDERRNVWTLIMFIKRD